MRNPSVDTLAKARVKGAHFDPEETMDYRLRLYSTKTNAEQLFVELK